MVKRVEKEENTPESFEEVLEGFVGTGEEKGVGKVFGSEGVDRVKRKMKKRVSIDLKGVKVLQMVVWAVRKGEELQDVDRFLSKLLKKVLDSVEKGIGEEDKGVLQMIIDEITNLLRAKEDISQKVLIRVVKVVKKVKEWVLVNEVVKALVASALMRDGEEAWVLIKKLLGSTKDLLIILLLSYTSNFENCKITPTFFVSNTLQIFKSSLKPSLTTILDILYSFCTPHTTNLLPYFRTLLLLSDFFLTNPNLTFISLPKLQELLFLSLSYSSLSNLPQKAQILSKLSQHEFASQTYLPGILPHIYDLLSSQLFFKRSKSMRVSNINLSYQLSLSPEEQTSEVYKAQILDLTIFSLQTHIQYLKHAFPASLCIVKVEIEQLQSSCSATVASRLKPLSKIS